MSTLFAIALLASGQNSTITGTLCRSNSYGRVLKTFYTKLDETLSHKEFGAIPVLLCLVIFRGNESKMEQLLVFSQVFLSIALPFSLIPLQLATSNEN